MIDALPLSPLRSGELQYRADALSRRLAGACADGYFEGMGERGEELRREFLLHRFASHVRAGVIGDPADYWAGIVVPS